jgi:hypothetical protein
VTDAGSSRPLPSVGRAFELRTAGASYREIARQLGVDPHTAHADIAADLEALREQSGIDRCARVVLAHRSKKSNRVHVPREVRNVTIALAVAGIAVNVNVTADVPQFPRTHSPSSTVLTATRIKPFRSRSALCFPMRSSRRRPA